MLLYSTDMLLNQTEHTSFLTEDRARYYADRIDSLFRDYNINASVVGLNFSEHSLIFQIKLEAGVRVKTIKELQHDFAYRLGLFVEIGPDPEGSHFLNIVLTQNDLPTVRLRSLLENPDFADSKKPLLIAAGYTHLGQPLYINLADSPHMLITGSTGAGKSVFIDDIILSLIYKNRPSELKLFLIDAKGVDLKYYDGIPHLVDHAISNRQEAMEYLQTIIEDMDCRKVFLSEENAHTFENYNMTHPENPLPRCVVIIDEYMELIQNWNDSKEVHQFVQFIDRIVSHGRMLGYSFIIATQHSSSKILSGSIKNNMLYKIRFSIYPSANDPKQKNSHVKLLGSGDMIFTREAGSGHGDNSMVKSVHAKAPLVTGDEVIAVVKEIKSKYPVEK